MPADWFTRETYPLLVQFCRHVVRSREVESALSVFGPVVAGDVDRLKAFDRLTKVAEREGRAISSLATRMRLTQHSRYHADKAAVHTRPSKSDKPWDRFKTG